MSVDRDETQKLVPKLYLGEGFRGRERETARSHLYTARNKEVSLSVFTQQSQRDTVKYRSGNGNPLLKIPNYNLHPPQCVQRKSK